MAKLFRKWHKKSLYKKSLMLFTLFLLVCGFFIIVYVYNSMVLYERNLVDNYIKYLATSGKLTEDVKDDLFTISKYEKNNDKLISTVSIKSVNSYKRMAILTIDEWDVVNYQNYFDKGIYAYEIKVLEKYTVKVNGNTLRDDDIVSQGDVEGLDRLTEYVEIEKSKTYEVNNLVYKPEIKILDENNK